MNKIIEDQLDPKAKGVISPAADYDRNRGGIYGGLPQARQASDAEREESAEKTAEADFDRNRSGIYGGLPKARLDLEPANEEAVEGSTKADIPTV